MTTLEDVTRGKLQWSEAAGLKQVVRNIDINEDTKFEYLLPDYDKASIKRVSS